MSTIQTSLIPIDGLLRGHDDKKQNQSVGGGDFEALLAMATNAVSKKPNNISALGLINAVPPMDDVGPGFSFSPAFAATFGLSGPLPDFISMMTSKLHLTAAQNQALQDIAVRNSSATRSDEMVQQIALELNEAGIIA